MAEPGTLSPQTEAAIRAIHWRRFTADQAVEIGRRWQGGEDAQAIGAPLGASTRSIAMTLGQMKQAGIALRIAHPSRTRPRRERSMDMNIEETLSGIDREIGSRIRHARKAKGLSQSQLGEVLNVSFQQVQKYERGTNRVSSSALVLVARALDTTPAALLGNLDAADVASPEMDLARSLLLAPHGLEIARAVVSLTGRQAGLVAEVAGALVTPAADSAALSRAA